MRTGVTVILPHAGDLFRRKVRAAVHTINGFGKACGFEQVRELGQIETPIALTNTLNVWRVADALVDHALGRNPEIGIRTGTVNPVVAECNDGYLNDIQGRHVRAEHVLQAIATAAPGAVVEGAVGAGTGTTCYGWKGGIGTASRVTPADGGGYTVGALVQSNFGRAAELCFGGVPVGRVLHPPEAPGRESGSVVVVLATDAPAGRAPVAPAVRARRRRSRTYGRHDRSRQRRFRRRLHDGAPVRDRGRTRGDEPHASGDDDRRRRGRHALALPSGGGSRRRGGVEFTLCGGNHLGPR